MPQQKIVSRKAWLAARLKLLAEEKALTKAREALTARRQAMPWTRVEEDYLFEGESGPVSLSELFDRRSQLIIYHFMFHPDWETGCKSCSFWADGYDRMVVHLKARDVSMATVSRAPIGKLKAFREQMGWEFTWVSSAKNSFNRDFGVLFTPAEITSGEADYNYHRGHFPVEDAPGISVFARGKGEEIFHSYSCYSRGLEMLNPGYHLLDLVPKGRDEAKLAGTMDWLRRRNEYDEPGAV